MVVFAAQLNVIHEMINPDHIIEVLRKCWSSKSSSKWNKNNPALGQCSVSSLVIQHFYGGEILKTKVSGEWHFYNKIDDKIFDFTAEQFHSPIDYSDNKSNKIEALKDTSQTQYEYLKNAFQSEIKQIQKQ